MMFEKVKPEVEVEVKTEGATSTRVANLRKRVEGRRMKVKEGLVDELASVAGFTMPGTGEKGLLSGQVLCLASFLIKCKAKKCPLRFTLVE
jgi:hypothetical protein